MQKTGTPKSKDLRSMSQKMTADSLKDKLKNAAKNFQEPEKPLIKLEDMDIRQWEASITGDVAGEVLHDIESRLLPWVRASEKLNVFIHMQSAAIQTIHKGGKAPRTVRKLTERVAPVISVKENVDEYLSEVCTKILEKLEDGDYGA